MRPSPGDGKPVDGNAPGRESKTPHMPVHKARTLRKGDSTKSRKRKLTPKRKK
jgi:hypothetical protein